jgi:hypothetical protein
MNIVRLVACGVVLLVGMIWHSAGAEAQGDKCRKVMGEMLKQAEDPSNEELIRLRTECPEDVSFKDVNHYRESIKEARRKITEAVAIVKSVVEELIKNTASTGQEGTP